MPAVRAPDRRSELLAEFATGQLMPSLTLNEVALVLKRSRWTVQTWIRRGMLRKKAGRIPAAEVRKFLS